MKDYYTILGVGKNANADEIKRAYRKLAHQHHPDKKGGDEKNFKEINEAYQVLGDTQKRKQYDQFGTSGSSGFSGFSGGDASGWDFGDAGILSYRSYFRSEDVILLRLCMGSLGKFDDAW